VSISFFIALFSCDFAHGQQEDDTTSIPAIGALMRPISTLAPLITPLSPPIPPSTTNNIPQQQEQIIGSDSLVPIPSPGSGSSLPIEEELADRPLFQPQGEQTSETQLTVEQEQRQQQLTVNEILKDPTGQAAELIEEEKEGTELEIKQRLDEIWCDEDGDNEGSQRGGVREEQNNRDDNANSDTINDGEAPLDLQLPIPFP
jgi:flagellar motor protein MotB